MIPLSWWRSPITKLQELSWCFISFTLSVSSAVSLSNVFMCEMQLVCDPVIVVLLRLLCFTYLPYGSRFVCVCEVANKMQSVTPSGLGEPLARLRRSHSYLKVSLFSLD